MLSHLSNELFQLRRNVLSMAGTKNQKKVPVNPGSDRRQMRQHAFTLPSTS